MLLDMQLSPKLPYKITYWCVSQNKRCEAQFLHLERALDFVRLRVVQPQYYRDLTLSAQ